MVLRGGGVRRPMGFHGGAAASFAGWPGWAQTLAMLVLVAFVGWLAIRVAVGLLGRTLERSRAVDATLKTFLLRLARAAAYTVLFVVLLTIVGVDLAALLGGLAIGGFVVGFALKDSLGNLAAGVVLLLYRPFDVGDAVEIDGYGGVVLELGISLTIVRRFDGVIVSIPNGSVLGGPIVNFTRATNRRAAVTVGIEAEDDPVAAGEAIVAAMRRDARILADPAPEVVVINIDEDGVDLEARAWAKNADYGAVLHALRPLARVALRDAGFRAARRELVVTTRAQEPGA